MKHLRKICITIGAIGLAACSNADLYRAAQEHNQAECRKGPPADYQDCIERNSEPYEEYQRKRGEY